MFLKVFTSECIQEGIPTSTQTVYDIGSKLDYAQHRYECINLIDDKGEDLGDYLVLSKTIDDNYSSVGFFLLPIKDYAQAPLIDFEVYSLSKSDLSNNEILFNLFKSKKTCTVFKIDNSIDEKFILATDRNTAFLMNNEGQTIQKF